MLYMKNFSVISIVAITLLTSSCSWLFGKDKNELQPKLGGAQRTPVNQNYAQPQMLDTNQQPQAPQPPQAEVFVNQNPAPGIAMPQNAAPDFMNVQQQPPQMPVPQPAPQMQAAPQMPAPMPTTMNMMAPQPVPAPVAPQMIPAPQQPVIPGEQLAIVTISKTINLPASLQPAYNNPLNYEQPIAMIQPAIQPVQPVMIPQPPQPTMLQPVNAPTQPVEQMQIYTQPSGQPMR